MTKMNILGVIPARSNSKGLKNKNLLPVLGKPVIAYTIEAALASDLLERTVVSTNGQEIANVAESYGIPVVRRPEEFCTDTAPIEWALRHAVKEMEQQGFHADVVVWLQANVPCRHPTAIDRAISKLLETGADSVATGYHVPHFYLVKRMEAGDRIVPYEKGMDIFRRQDAPPLFLVDGAVFAIKKDVLMGTEGREGLHVFLGGDVRGLVQDRQYTIEIDEEMDLKLAEFFIGYERE